MSQSATLVRVAKHALDGAPIYPHHGQNPVYYQTVDNIANMKYLAYTIQRPSDQLINLNTRTRSMKRLLSGNDLSTSSTNKIPALNSTIDDHSSNSQSTNVGHSNSENSEVKKARIEKSSPSRVIHLRNIDASELEIVQFGLSFGKITNLLNLRKKNQAFLEFDSIESAQAMNEHFSSLPIVLNGRQIFVQFSNHQELKTDPNNANNQQAQAALHSATVLYEIAKNGGQNCVLRVIVSNMLYSVNVETFHQIFSKFGVVLKIITFTKNDKFQALIQMKDATTTQSAKLALNGHNIYNGCCTLQVDFSKLQALNVKYNNDKSRDYTNPTLPSSENSTEPISIGSRYFPGIPNVYGSPIMTLAGAPLTTLSSLNNNALHFPNSTSTILNASQLNQPYTTTLTCPMTNNSSTGGATTLLTTHPNPHGTLSMSNLSTNHQHSNGHPSAASPYIFLSTAQATAASGNTVNDEVCAHGVGGGTSVVTGKTATLSSPSTLYFYNNNHHHHHGTPTMCTPLTFYACDRQL